NSLCHRQFNERPPSRNSVDHTERTRQNSDGSIPGRTIMPALPETPEYVRFDEFGGFLDAGAVDVAIAGRPTATDLFIFAHGWNNDFATASANYRQMLGQMNAVAANGHFPTGRFEPLTFGVIWPSKAWDESALESFVDDRSALAAIVPDV